MIPPFFLNVFHFIHRREIKGSFFLVEYLVILLFTKCKFIYNIIVGYLYSNVNNDDN